ncbi:hypothetical protein DINM_006190 [Dirofilaria immitis]|nr:hypothetical protein [Dirofilaria immitis]
MSKFGRLFVAQNLDAELSRSLSAKPKDNSLYTNRNDKSPISEHSCKDQQSERTNIFTVRNTPIHIVSKVRRHTGDRVKERSSKEFIKNLTSSSVRQFSSGIQTTRQFRGQFNNLTGITIQV